MTMLANCPLPSYIRPIALTACPQKWGQIQKMAFGRVTDGRFANNGAFISQAVWQALLAVTTDAKIVVSPYFANMTFPVGAPVETGGNDNTTINGLSDLAGGQKIKITFRLTNQSAQTMREIRDLAAESMIQPGISQIGVYLFNNNREIIYDETSATGLFNVFKIYNLFVPDVSSLGLNTNNTYDCSFEVPFGWSEFWAKQQMPVWNPLDLANAAS